MEQFHVNRLKRLQQILADKTPDQINLRHFAEKKPCGTIACIGGWAGLDPSFRRRGLKTIVEKSAPLSRVDLYDNYGKEIETKSSFNALGIFFGLDEVQTCQLFNMRDWGEYNGLSDHELVQQRFTNLFAKIKRNQPELNV